MNDYWILYRGVRNLVGVYWSAYGGWKALVQSPYFHVACLLGVLSVFFADNQSPIFFYDLALSILPNLLGFTLGGFAILMAFGDSDFLSLLCGRRQGEVQEFSPLVNHAANYMHFLVVQSVVLLFAVLTRATGVRTWAVNLVGYIGLYYAICLSLATVASIFRMVKRYDTFKELCIKRRDLKDDRDDHSDHE